MPFLLLQGNILYANFQNMRMFLLFILLMSPIMASAVTCSSFNNAPETCGNTAGCHYDSETIKCKKCAEDHYCPGNNNAQPHCNTAGNGTFDNSDEGAESPAECYKTITCKKADDSNDNQCRHYNNTTDPYRCGDNHDISAHMEGTQCYYNTRNCDKFGTPSGCNGGTVTGQALWATEDEEWYINGNIYYCQCEQGNVEYPTASCTATVVKRPTSGNPTSANASITYGNVSSYYCTQCPPGYYVHIENGFLPTTNCTGGNTVCVCDIANPGHYSTGCGPFSNNITNHAFCPYQDCPFGQTSPEGATAITDCNYASQTQFCDAKGCFTLGTDATNWRALY